MNDLLDPDSAPDEDVAEFEEVVEIPIEDSLDLHTFQPREVRDLLDDYLEAACGKGFREVRIIHGKGIGVLRRRVLSVLEKHPLVAAVRPAGPEEGSWGATVATLRSGPDEPGRNQG